MARRKSKATAFKARKRSNLAKMKTYQKRADKLGEKINVLTRQRDSLVYKYRALDVQNAEIDSVIEKM